jgi:hypothetical protein
MACMHALARATFWKRPIFAAFAFRHQTHTRDVHSLLHFCTIGRYVFDSRMDHSFAPVSFRLHSPNIPKLSLSILYLVVFVTGTSSAMEVASCVPQIFGNDDIDVLSWDFGM